MLLTGDFVLTISRNDSTTFFNWISPILGVIVGAALTFAIQLILQVKGEKASRIRESRARALEAYAQLTALASQELERARNLEATLVLSGAKVDDSTDDGTLTRLKDLYRNMDQLRVQLATARFRCLLNETDPQLQQAIEHLASKQSFVLVVGDFRQRNEQLEKFKGDVNAYEAARYMPSASKFDLNTLYESRASAPRKINGDSA